MAHATTIRIGKERIDGYGDKVSAVALLNPYFRVPRRIIVGLHDMFSGAYLPMSCR